MGLIDKIKESTHSIMQKAKDKLAYSEEEIAERMKKDGIVYVFDGGNGTLLEVYEIG